MSKQFGTRGMRSATGLYISERPIFIPRFKMSVHCHQLQNRRIFFISFVLPSFHFSGFQFVLLQKFLTATDRSTVVFPPFEKAAALVEPDQKWTSQLSFVFRKPLPTAPAARSRRDGRGDRVVSRGDPRSSGRGPHARCDRGDDRCLPDRAPAAVRVAAWRRNRPRRPRTASPPP